MPTQKDWIKITDLRKISIDASHELDSLMPRKNCLDLAKTFRRMGASDATELLLYPPDKMAFYELFELGWLPKTKKKDDERFKERANQLAGLLESNSLEKGQMDQLLTFCIEIHDEARLRREPPQSFDGLGEDNPLVLRWY